MLSGQRSRSGGYQQPEKKLYDGTALQAAWVDLRSFLKVLAALLHAAVCCSVCTRSMTCVQ